MRRRPGRGIGIAPPQHVDRSAFRSANLAVIARRWPALARALAAHRGPPPAGWSIARTTAGVPALSVEGQRIDHPVDPAAGARRWANLVVERAGAIQASRIVLIGFGLGHQAAALVDLGPRPLVVLEPRLDLLAAALGERDLGTLLESLAELRAGDDAVSDLAAEADSGCEWVDALPGLLTTTRRDHADALEQARRRLGRGDHRPLRISVVAPLYGGSHPIALAAARALRRLHHEVELLDLAPFQAARQALGLFTPKASARLGLEAGLTQVLGRGVLAHVRERRPDVLLALAQAPLDAEVLQQIGREGILRAMWFVEDHRLMDYWRTVAPHYDAFFSIEGPAAVATISAEGAGLVAHLPCAADPEVHRPLELGPGERRLWGSDVSFVGAGYRNRREGLRRFADLDFRIWGNDWAQPGPLAGFLQRGGRRISSEETVRIFNATRVNLNLHSSSWCDGVDPQGDFVNPRTFEIAACGAFQVVDRRAGLAGVFAAEDGLAVAATMDEMRDLTRHHLARPEECSARGASARRRVLRDHTYEHRMADLIAALRTRWPERLMGERALATVAHARARAPDGLREFLGRLPAETPLRLDALARGIGQGSGDLDDAEGLVLFLHQFSDLYLAEAGR